MRQITRNILITIIFIQIRIMFSSYVFTYLLPLNSLLWTEKGTKWGCRDSTAALLKNSTFGRCAQYTAGHWRADQSIADVEVLAASQQLQCIIECICRLHRQVKLVGTKYLLRKRSVRIDLYRLRAMNMANGLMSTRTLSHLQQSNCKWQGEGLTKWNYERVMLLSLSHHP